MIRRDGIAAHVTIADDARDALLQINMHRERLEEVKCIHDQMHADLWRLLPFAGTNFRIVGEQLGSVLR